MARFVPLHSQRLSETPMNRIVNRWIRLRCLGAMFIVAVALLAPCADAGEQVLPLLVTKTGSFTNATVTTKTKSYVFVLHATGMANVRVEDLSPEARTELGYDAPKRKASTQVPGAALVRDLLPKIETRLKPLQARILAQIPVDPALLQPTRNHLYIAAGSAAALFLFFSYCCHLIGIKSKKTPTLLAWLPGFQLIPLLRAAEMSGWWILLAFLPIVPLIWAFKIAKARGMSVLVSIFLILPVTNLFAFLYLAFGREAPSKEVPRYQSMSLQTA
jgi:hypothetical protein